MEPGCGTGARSAARAALAAVLAGGARRGAAGSHALKGAPEDRGGAVSAVLRCDTAIGRAALECTLAALAAAARRERQRAVALVHPPAQLHACALRRGACSKTTKCGARLRNGTTQAGQNCGAASR